MKKALLSIICMFLTGHFVLAQTTISTSIYKYGDNVTTCETNFKNLFENWKPDIIETANDIHLLSYKFVEELNNNEKIENYINWFSDPQTIGTISCRATSTDTFNSPITTSSCKQWIQMARYGDALSKEELEILKDMVKSCIQKGDKVYVIKYKYRSVEHEAFAVCRPRTCEVVWDNMFQSVTVRGEDGSNT